MKSPTLTKSTCATQVEQQPRVENVMTNMRGGELPDAPPKRVENTFPSPSVANKSLGETTKSLLRRGYKKFKAFKFRTKYSQYTMNLLAFTCGIGSPSG